MTHSVYDVISIIYFQIIIIAVINVAKLYHKFINNMLCDWIATFLQKKSTQDFRTIATLASLLRVLQTGIQ